MVELLNRIIFYYRGHEVKIITSPFLCYRVNHRERTLVIEKGSDRIFFEFLARTRYELTIRIYGAGVNTLTGYRIYLEGTDLINED